MELLSIFFLVGLTTAFAIANLLDCKITDQISSSLFIAVIWILIFGSVNQLILGLQTLPFMSLLLLIFAIYKKGNIFSKQNLKFHLSPSLFIFVGLSTWAYFLTRAMRLSEWDEFTHWGLTIKNLFLFDSLGPLSPAFLGGANYLPGLSILPYALMKIDGVWREGNIFFGYQLIIFAIFASVITRFSWRKIHLAVLSILLMGIASVVFYNTFKTIYADPLLGIVFSYLLFLSVSKTGLKTLSRSFNFSISLIFFVLIKETALALSIIPISLYAFNLFLELRTKKIRSFAAFRISIASLFSFIAIATLTKFSWSYFTSASSLDSNISETSSKAFGNVFDRVQYLFFDQSSNLNSIFPIFLDRVINGNVATWIAFNLSTMDWLLLTLTLFFLFLAEAPTRYKSGYTVGNFLIVTLGSLFYLFILLIVYVTVYSGANSFGLTSFDRYVSSLLSGILMLVVFMACQTLLGITNDDCKMDPVDRKTISTSFSTATALTLGLLLLLAPNGRIISYLSDPSSYLEPSRKNTEFIASKISQINLTEKDRVWVIAQHTMGYEFYVIQYELFPSEVGQIPFSIGSRFGDGDIWTDPNVNLEVWNKNLNEYDYVVVYKISEQFFKEFGPIFEDPSILLKEPAIFQVIHSPSGNKLRLFF